MHKDMYNVLAL